MYMYVRVYGTLDIKQVEFDSLLHHVQTILINDSTLH